MATHRFAYPSVVESEERFLNDLAQVAQRERLEEDVRRAMMLTLSEAFTNALVHGNRLDPAKTVWVEVRVDEATVSAEVADEGNCGLAELAARPQTGQLDDHGRGIGLMEHFAAEVVFG
ncbi:MAG TPA: ATP-binding protein, partial [candidate division Zixibacteria bacterium]|nr:ATP-binding protein [candidate division Zixibacteria bacterium]